MIISEETGTEIGCFSQFYVLLEGCKRLPHVCNQLHCMKEMRFAASRMSETGYSINVTNYTILEISFQLKTTIFDTQLHGNAHARKSQHICIIFNLENQKKKKHSLTYVIHGDKLDKH